VVAPEPLTPRVRIRDNQFAVLTADPVLLASLGGPRVVHELSSLACARVLSLESNLRQLRGTCTSVLASDPVRGKGNSARTAHIDSDRPGSA